ncbi:LPXTG cell wall anchor domain-containing protein [Actinoplanes sp. KI2]|uniref:LPXTG cell wall anchor domain-containing protein n=1 Tax=Actinoplanes sp. KI2 TaxID=2983315 RepID=UPI0021D58BAB|nr:LPXTG cell wall anchor domain-containing protein [Actinoplanes sp. KI2]MCU7723656.1 LPXTG cell wall anchor domain-containing protein [Actinoplanes sp. KI2]
MRKPLLLRTATVLAGAVLGMAGLTAFAGPASAHDADVKGATQCVNGKNQVTWTITNDWVDTDGAKVENLKLPAGDTPVQVGNAEATLHEGTVLLPATHQGDSTVQFTQNVDQADSVTLSFDARWSDWVDHDNSATVTLIKDCQPPAPKCVEADQARFNHTFVVDKDGATTVINLNDDVNLCDDVAVPVTSVSYYAPKPQFSVPQYLFDKDSGKITNKDRTLKLHVDIPPCFTQVDTFFGTEDDILQTITDNGPRYGDKKLGSPGAPGNRSKGPQAWYNGGDKSCVTPDSTAIPSCDGSQAINLSNNGKYDQTFTVKYGDQVKTVVVKAGKGETVTVPAGAGTVTVSAEGMDDQKYTWTAPKDCPLPTVALVNDCTTVTVTVTNPKGVVPAEATITYGDQTKKLTVAAGSSEKATFDAGTATYATIKIAGLDKEIKAALKELVCATPTTGGGAGGPVLPITGAAAGTIAGVAALLLAVGGVLFFLARRRKVNFTA